MSQIAKPFIISDADLTALNEFITKDGDSVRKSNRARVLKLSHQGKRPQQISTLLGISIATVYNLRKRYKEHGLELAISEKARPGHPRKVTSEVEDTIADIAYSKAPSGSTGWTAKLINDQLIKLDIHIHNESVRLALRKINSNRPSKNSSTIGK